MSYKVSSAKTRPLIAAGKRLYAQRAQICALSPLVVMSDPARTPDVFALARNLPKNSAFIYRHFGNYTWTAAHTLRQICFERDCQFLIGKDWKIAMLVGADGVHLPQHDIHTAASLRARFPDWIISAAVHDKAAIDAANAEPLDAVILSSLFASPYKDGPPVLFAKKFAALTAASSHPVFALGGLNDETVSKALDLSIAGIAGVSGFV